MKWKLLLGMVALTVILSLVSNYLYPIHLLIILAPLIIGTFVIISTTILHIVILAVIWILIYIFVISRGIF